MMRSTLRHLCIAACGLVFGTAPLALAQDTAALTRVTDLNKKAVEAYENLEMEEASKFLRQALELCAAEGLNSHKVKARTHIHLGIVMVGGLKQRDRGIQQFKRALEIDPSITPTKTLLNPEIQAAFDEALKERGGGGAATPPPVAAEPPPRKADPAPPPPVAEPPAPAERPAASAETKPPGKIKGVFHEPVTEAKPSTTISVKAAIESGLGAEKVVLAYRPEGSADFLARDMEKDPAGWYVARIPEPATRGSLVSYYIEARNRGGQALAANGSAGEPHVISLLGADGGADSEDPPGIAEEAGDDEEGGPGHTYWLSMGLGSGYGWAKGTPEVNATDAVGRKLNFPGGFAPALLVHLAPEVGYFISPRMMISLQGRFQIVTGATEVRHASCSEQKDASGRGLCEPAKGAIALLGKATWLLGEPKPFRPFVSVAAGGGEIRHLISIENLTDCGPQGRTACKDTVLGGIVLVGPGAGFTYDLSKTLSFVASLNSLVGLPKPTVNFDINVGMALGL